MKSLRLFTKTPHSPPTPLASPPSLGSPTDLRMALAYLLRRRRFSRAASLVQRAASELPSATMAALALDVGNYCRHQKAINAATSCFLTARRCAPQKEDPLARLADLFLESENTVPLGLRLYQHLGQVRHLGPTPTPASQLFLTPENLRPEDDTLQRLLAADLPVTPRSATPPEAG